MRLQTAIEFLTTYGWAFIVITVVMLALFETGFFNPSTYSAQSCVMSSGFSCLSFFIYSNGLLYANIQQATGSPINVTAVGCSSNTVSVNTQAPYNPPSNQIYLPIGANYTFAIQCYTSTGPVSSNSLNTFSGTLKINYTDDITSLPSSATGAITTKLT
ncbi:MAG: hypothetical protein M1286_04395 [Candidatus Marsarchaeota archaeon]|nr:hypothetical protein [Candidatus Marsarchaeota archaeon]